MVLRRPLPGVAEWPWNQWPNRRGTGGRISVESVAECPWNGWPNGRGIRTRRWEEEKCFDTWKNGFSQAKAWGKRAVAIDKQVRLAIVSSILVAMMLAKTFGDDGLTDTKALRRQARRPAKAPEQPDGTDRPDWTVPLFRYTAKVSRQVLRFFKHCFLKPASAALYERELRPLLMAYL